MPIKDRIVAEITKNWPTPNGGDVRLISQRFEDVIATNKKRGYELESWRLNSVHIPLEYADKLSGLAETIVAVFTKENE